MWPFSKAPIKTELIGLKEVRVNGGKYTIKRINPLLDFDSSSMPQIFTTYQSRRKKTEEPAPADAAKVLADMINVVRVGIVKPELVPVGNGELRGKEDGITVEDLFRDATLGANLYWEIVVHSLNHFKGVRGAYFLARTRRMLSISWLQNSVKDPAISPLSPANSV